MGFYAKWSKTKCPACGEPWAVGDDLDYNSDDVVVHLQCAIDRVPTNFYKGAKTTVCPKCHLEHPSTYDCEL